MEGGHSSSGGPAPFLLKTYDMVDDSATDDIVSWSSTKNSFVVWNPPEFARLLLPTYFKHNNFSSFIRQLNTYGFRKIDPERWEFANEEFAKDQKHLLKNIHRRKPIHSHSQPPGSLGDNERAALEEEMERLSREKSVLQSDLWKFKQQTSGTKVQFEELERRVQEMEQRQLRMMSFLAKAVQNRTFMEHLVRMAGSSDLSAINKKRRLPKGDYSQDLAENSFIDNQSTTSKPEFGHNFHQDFSSKLKLELCPAVSDNQLISASVQSSSEDRGSAEKEQSEGVPKETQMRTAGLPFVSETLELSDTGNSISFKENAFLSTQVRMNESSELQCLGSRSMTAEECDGHISCHLNLTLASLPSQVNDRHVVDKIARHSGHDLGSSADMRSSANDKETNLMDAKNQTVVDNDATMSSLQEAPGNNPIPAAAQGRVNDVFWEQFLTERPGSSDTEEASSSLRATPYDEVEERKSGNGKLWRSKKDLEQLTL